MAVDSRVVRLIWKYALETDDIGATFEMFPVMSYCHVLTIK